MTVDLINIYKSFLEAQGIQFLLLNDTLDQLEQMDFGFRKSVFKEFDYSNIKEFLNKLFQEENIISIKDRLQLSYCIFKFPEEYRKEYNAPYGMIGPVHFEPVTPAEIKKMMHDNHIPDVFFDPFVELYNQTPTLSSADTWFALLRPFLTEIFGDYISIHNTSYNEIIRNTYNTALLPDSSSLQSIEERYYIGDQMLKAVTKGDKGSALEWYRKLEHHRLVPRVANEIRNQKNELMTLNILFQKALYDTGIHPFYVDQIANNQALAIELETNIHELNNMPASMIRKYCMVIHNHNYQSYSAPVERCLQYIEFFYSNPLTLDELARHCYVTSNYLSSLFKKEIGITLKEYINQFRIRKAVFLLNTTQLSIQEIAGQCGFPDANYFSRIFKKVNGVTPLSYRKNINK